MPHPPSDKTGFGAGFSRDALTLRDLYQHHLITHPETRRNLERLGLEIQEWPLLELPLPPPPPLPAAALLIHPDLEEPENE